MIEKLLVAYSLEKQNFDFGPQDIKGSITSLINRGLIKRIDVEGKHKNKSIWHVSYEAIEMLKALGIDVICIKSQVKGLVKISFPPLVELYYSTNHRGRYLKMGRSRHLK